MTVRRTEVTIEHLLLEGVRPSDAPIVGEALERELARLVHERGTPQATSIGGAGERPISIDRRAGESPSALGARLAGAIYGRLSS